MDKAALRQHYLHKRKALTDQEFALKNQAILDQVTVHTFKPDALVHIFLPIARQNEPDTYAIRKVLTERYPNIRFVISRSMQDQPKMYHFIWDERTVFKINSWGIPEPAGGELVQPLDLDIIFVPLLIFDLEGHRVGYGKGYYDRFLMECRPEALKVGLSLFEGVNRIQPRSPGDIPLDMVITPNGVIKF